MRKKALAHHAFPLIQFHATMTNIAKVDVVGVGLNATDILLPVREFPQRGDKIEIRSANAMLGGQVASAMVACQQWGLRTRYIGKLGEDHAAWLHREEFERLGVETRLFVAKGCSSQQAFILVDSLGERTVLWKRDSALTLLPDELQRQWVVDARLVHLDGHDTAAAALAARWAQEAGIPVVADLDELYPGVEALLPGIDFLITSRDIPGKLAGQSDLRRSLPKVFRQYRCQFAEATLGSDGVLAWDGQKFHYVPAFQVGVLDTTGAGDAFHAGFIYGFLQGWPTTRTLEFACAAAALNCTAIGARGGIQPVQHIESLMANGPRHRAVFDKRELE
jgi:sulfofructose kinase